jgi:hypothetical protein
LHSKQSANTDEDTIGNMAKGGTTLSTVTAGGKGANFRIDTYGMNETLRALRLFDKDMYDHIRKNIADASQPLAKVVGERFPDEKPLSGWHTSGRKGPSRMPGYSPGAASKGVKAIAGTGLARGKGRTILRIQQTNAGGMVFDTAGSANNSQFVMNLDKHRRTKSKQNGWRSRILYPATAKNFTLIEAALRSVLRTLEQQTQQRLSSGIGGRF